MLAQNAVSAALGAMALSLLSSCSGAGGGIGQVAAQRLIGGEPPAETGSVQEAREAEILRRSDSYILTARTFESEDGEVVINVPVCAGATCSFGTAGGGSVTEGLDNLVASTGTTILSRRGLTVLRTDDPENELSYLGSALNHSSFGAVRSGTEIGGERYTIRYGASIGDSAGSRPAASGTWTGLMTGIHWRGDDLLLGDARLVYIVSATGGSMSAEFSNIRNVAQNRAHDIEFARFSGISVAADGTFRAGGAANRIQGGFYGDGHAEATGVFERSGILGAFGTHRRD